MGEIHCGHFMRKMRLGYQVSETKVYIQTKLESSLKGVSAILNRYKSVESFVK